MHAPQVLLHGPDIHTQAVQTATTPSLPICQWQRTQHWVTQPFTPAMLSSAVLVKSLSLQPAQPVIMFHSPLHVPRMVVMLDHMVKVGLLLMQLYS